MAITRKSGKTNTKAKTIKKTAKRRRPRDGDSPINVGGGGGLTTKRAGRIIIGNANITFDRKNNDPQKRWERDSKNRRKYGLPGGSLSGIEVFDDGNPVDVPEINRIRRVFLTCTDIRGPGYDVEIVVISRPFTIEFPAGGDFVDYAGDYFHCTYLGVIMIETDDWRHEFSNGRCRIVFHSG
ncbi:MAG TPA: hypothetical protein VGQ72_03105 [Pyrinomonadaceae bacterium]|jgi:hypothetical protein|nr:hypothetical protein [Pyrinomonadaceae bacterium]